MKEQWSEKLSRVARGRIGAAAAGRGHSHSHSHSSSNAGSKPNLPPIPQLMVMSDPYPLSEARDWMYILMDTSWFMIHWATRSSPGFFLLWNLSVWAPPSPKEGYSTLLVVLSQIECPSHLTTCPPFTSIPSQLCKQSWFLITSESSVLSRRTLP